MKLPSEREIFNGILNEAFKKYDALEKINQEQALEIANLNKRLENENKQLKDTLSEILHFCNHLHNDCKYRLNDGYIRKIINICKKTLNEEKENEE